jgi:hypothetical protein
VKSIFVSVVSFNEPFLKETILSAIKKSSKPERIYFGVVEQRTDSNFADLKEIKNVKHISMQVGGPLGVGIPRKLSMELLDNQDYCLIIDSHMIFNDNWDENIIRRIKHISKIYSEKVIISQHLPVLDVDDNNLVLYPEKKKDTPCYLKFDGIFIDDIPIPNGHEFYQQYALTCHYLFSLSKSFKEVVFDPRIFYFAEESSLAMRFITRGYKIFSTRYFPMFHLQKTNGKKIKSWQTLNGTSRLQDDIEIVYSIFSGKEIGVWGAPSKCRLDDFLAESRLDISYYMSGVDHDLDINKQIRSKIVDMFDNGNDFYENLYQNFIPAIRSPK